MAAEGDDLLRTRLAELGPKPWHASGSFQPPQGSLKLSFEHEGRRISLPLSAAPPPDDALQALLAAASASPFAKQGKTVVDPSYRAALELAPGAFESGVALPPAGVLAEAAAVLAPDARDVCAELIKLNIYGPGAFFKAHRDTPMGAKHVGSLVVCLPCGPHKGGDLVLRHQGKEHRWSTAEAVAGSAEGATRLQWCAFFPDTEHEVLPVSAGHRLTLSYNLYSAARPPAAKAGGKRKAGEVRGLPTTSASLAAAAHAPELSAERDAPGAVAALRTLLANPAWHPEGGKLGVILGHKYAAGLEGLRDNMFPSALKGRDRLLYAVFASSGLEVRTAPIFKGWESEDYVPYEEAMAGLEFWGNQGPLPTRDEWYLQHLWVGESFDTAWRKMKGPDDPMGYGWDDYAMYSDDNGMEEYALELKAQPTSRLGISWVTPLDEEKAFLQMDKIAATGNGSLWYKNYNSGACLVVTVPPAGQGGRTAAVAPAPAPPQAGE